MILSKIPFTIILVAVLLISGCPSPPPSASLVTITFRETMQFYNYVPAFNDPNPAGNYGFTSYYTITCINNNQGSQTAQPADFMFDISKVSFVDSNGTRSPVITKDIVGPFNWKNSYLTASSTFVPKGAVIKPSQPFAFVIIIPNAEAADQGANHNLRYDSIQGQPVTMINDTHIPPPLYNWAVGTADFIKGQFIGNNVPTLPPPICP